MTIDQMQDQIIEEFDMFDEWMDKYEYLIDLSRNLPVIDDKHKTQQNLISGCQSKVWLHARLTEDGKVQFSADSDAMITRGIIALLIRVLNNRTPKEIMETDLYFIDKIGLSQNLSPTRSNGLLAMVKQMKAYSVAFHHKLQNQ